MKRQLNKKSSLNFEQSEHGERSPAKTQKTHHVGLSLQAISGNRYKWLRPLSTWWVFCTHQVNAPMGQIHQTQPKENSTRSQNEMEILDGVLEQTELSNQPDRYVTVYKNKVDKSNLFYNLFLSVVIFFLSFLISGGSFIFGVIITVIFMATMMRWREIDQEIKIPRGSKKMASHKPNQKLSPKGQEALRKYAKAVGLLKKE